MRIKVLHIIGSGTLGGAQNFVYQLAGWQHKNDMEVDSTIFFRKKNGVFYMKSVQDGLNTSSCSDKLSFMDFIFIFRYFKNFHILHFHGLYPLLFLAAIFSRRRIMYYVHGSRAMTKSVKTLINDSIARNKKRKLPTRKGFIRFLKRQWYIFFLKHIVSTIHAPSQHYVDLYIQTYRVPKRKISLLPLGINTSCLQPDKTNNEVKKEMGITDEKVIGCVTTFRRLKRIDRLIDGVAIFENKPINHNIKLLIVGDGEERQHIEDKISHKNLGSKVILTGYRQDIPNFLNMIDIFVLPSESESFSIAIVEAMYFSKPFIVFKGSAGAEEMARKSKAGIIVNNEFELADNIKYLLDDKEAYNQLGAKGHEFVMNNLTLERFGKNIGNVYRELI